VPDRAGVDAGAAVGGEASAPPPSPPDDDEPSVPAPSELGALDWSVPPAFPALDPTALRRSFFAQPEPLKWIVGGANAFLMGPPPQTGQSTGGSAYTPWTTSNRVPHAAQS
jgi:hypothetical protein